MSDIELIKLAGKASKNRIDWHENFQCYMPTNNNSENKLEGQNYFWNPLRNNADALSLAVELKIDIAFNDMYVMAFQYEVDGDGEGFAEARCVDDPLAATRRAIVRAAAHIGSLRNE